MRVFACMAVSLDGKIAPAHTGRFVAIGSKHDLEHLNRLRNEADAVIFGAETFRAWPKPHRASDPDLRLHHFIMSRSMDLDPQAELFQQPDFPVTVFTPNVERVYLPEHVNRVTLRPGEKAVPFILKHVQSLGFKALLLEGGGQIMHQFIESRALEELYLTIVPKVMGRPQAPGLLGNRMLTAQTEIQVLRHIQHEGETYLHLKINYL